MSNQHELMMDVGAIHLKPQGKRSLATALAHNKRTLATGPDCSYDPALSLLNMSLFNLPGTSQAVVARAKNLMSDDGINIKREDQTVAAEFVFSLRNASDVRDMVKYFTESALWGAEYFKGKLLSADIHLDEGHPHCHVIVLLPLLRQGMTGSKLIGGFNELRTHMSSFFNSVAGRHGLRMPPKRLTGAARMNMSRDVMRIIGDCTDPEIMRVVRHVIYKCVSGHPDPWGDALAIQRPAPVTQARTLSQLAASRGAGEKTAAAQERSDRSLMARKVRSAQTSTVDVGTGPPIERHPSRVDVGDLPAVSSPSTDHSRPGESDHTADTREAPEAHSTHSAEPTDPPALPEYTRQRDADLDRAYFDHERGEYIKRLVQTRSGKAAARDWVEGGLLAQPGAAAPRVAR